jgi:adenine-specific DNA-methyltransferase
MNIKTLGQVFTPKNIVDIMLGLSKNRGNVLEPSCGDGAISNRLNEYSTVTKIEIDEAFKADDVLNIDFFSYSTDNKFDTIIGNPPYVNFKQISENTKNLLSKNFNTNTNLYVYFIEKCIRHLKPYGELIFIVPRDFLQATSAYLLNKLIYEKGTITDYIDFGEEQIFKNASPMCIIFRFEMNNFNRQTNCGLYFHENKGILNFSKHKDFIHFKDLFYVKVGALTGNNKIFENVDGNESFVYSETRQTGELRKMFFNVENEYIKKHKDILIQRHGVKPSDYYKFMRSHFISNDKRIYVNTKTRIRDPFFINECINYDGSVLGVFPRNQKIDIQKYADFLNDIDWQDLGFICGGRYLFGAAALENTLIPRSIYEKHFGNFKTIKNIF